MNAKHNLVCCNYAGPGATGVYYCLEDYKAIGAPLREVLIEPAPQTAASALKRTANSTAGLTSGQVARQCAAACDAETDCSGFRAVGPEVLGGGTCELLTNSTKALLAALAFNPEAPWPAVNANLTAADNNQLRSISWMCWRQQQDWDAFGQATHNMITAGQVDGEPPAVQRGAVCWTCSLVERHAGRSSGNFALFTCGRMLETSWGKGIEWPVRFVGLQQQCDSTLVS